MPNSFSTLWMPHMSIHREKLMIRRKKGRYGKGKRVQQLKKLSAYLQPNRGHS